MRTIIGLLATLLLAIVARPAGAENTNNHNAAFLRAGVDARHFGMGGTGVAFTDDAAALYWNPAGLARVEGLRLGIMATAGREFDRSQGWVGAAYGFGDWSLGFSWLNAATSGIDGFDAGGSPLGEFTFSENAFLLGAGVETGPVRLGATGKVLTQHTGADVTGTATATGVGFDIGAQFEFARVIQLGLAVQDVYSRIGATDLEDVDRVPANLRTGIAIGPPETWILAADLEKAEGDGEWHEHLGLEIRPRLADRLRVAARGGVDDGTWSVGFGVEVEPIRLDYAWVDETEEFLGSHHRFSVALAFGAPEPGRGAGVVRDADLDGFADDEDPCPAEAEDYDGFEDLDGCPDPDNDGDGIPDLDDYCPDVPGTAGNNGCPVTDTDGDGIPDDRDACPETAETVNGFEDDDGCPDDVSLALPDVQLRFASGSADLPASVPELDEAAAVMLANRSLRVEIGGHTDSVGREDANRALSERRAEAVRAYLVARGVAAERLTAVGYGESDPVADNATPEGRAANRRIAFRVLD
jgi:outer membrane protein OmpA-like peptidoglycan-associated protein